MPSAKVLEAKKAQVKELAEKIQSAKMVFFVDYKGITVDEENGSFECFVNGGYDYHTQIAEAIFDKKPIGIKTTGNIAQEIIDSGGNSHIINFSHTENISVYVRIALNTDNKFEGAIGRKDIKDNLVTYIDNIGIGNALVLSSLYGHIHSVTGVKEVTVLELSTDGDTWTADNIDVEQFESCICAQVSIKQDAAADYEVV